jgi:hypothetical protein
MCTGITSEPWRTCRRTDGRPVRVQVRWLRCAYAGLPGADVQGAGSPGAAVVLHRKLTLTAGEGWNCGTGGIPWPSGGSGGRGNRTVNSSNFGTVDRQYRRGTSLACVMPMQDGDRAGSRGIPKEPRLSRVQNARRPRRSCTVAYPEHSAWQCRGHCRLHHVHKRLLRRDAHLSARS